MGYPLIKRNEEIEIEFWEFVYKLNYPANFKNIEYCKDYLRTLSIKKQKQFRKVMHRLENDLYNKYINLDLGDIDLYFHKYCDALAFAVSLGEYEYYTILNEESYFLDYLMRCSADVNGFSVNFGEIFKDINIHDFISTHIELTN